MSNFRLLSLNGVRSLWAVLLPTFPSCILECYLSLLLPPPLICGSNTAGNLPAAGKVINQPTPGTHVELHARTHAHTHTHTHTHKHIEHGHEGRWMLTQKESQWVKEGPLFSHIHVQIQDETFLGDINANINDKTGLNWKVECSLTDHTTVSF